MIQELKIEWHPVDGPVMPEDGEEVLILVESHQIEVAEYSAEYNVYWRWYVTQTDEHIRFYRQPTHWAKWPVFKPKEQQ